MEDKAMSETDETKVNVEDIREATKKAVEEGTNIQEEVRNITLQALSEGSLDGGRIKVVARAVVEGADMGAAAHGEELKSALSQAISGLDEALVQSASATKLAIQEAFGRVKDYSEQDLKQAFQDLSEMEKNFIEVLMEVAKSSTSLAGKVLSDLAGHASRSGTAVGKQTAEVLNTLRKQVQHVSKESIVAGAGAAKTVSIQIARAASGVLAGIADRLEGKQTEQKSE
jgi:hypothetical protein